MTQLHPDWRQHWTAEQFTKELGLAFSGPGFYLSETDTILVISHDPATWRRDLPPDLVYEVNVYNSPLSKTVFAEFIPTRMDARP